MNRSIPALALVAALATAPALAQQTLGTILDRAPARLSKLEVEALVAGTNIVFKGTNPFLNAYVENNWDISADGKLSALQMRHVGALRGYGKWRVEPAGEWCVDIDFPRATLAGCYWLFRVGEEVWASTSRSDREAIATSYKITKLR